uniref:Peptidase S1 domain-containing protein n=1 Tax=Scylla olivacea TaxID=85551 RepID=A0A0P4WE11_SCYOL
MQHCQNAPPTTLLPVQIACSFHLSRLPNKITCICSFHLLRLPVKITCSSSSFVCLSRSPVPSTTTTTSSWSSSQGDAGGPLFCEGVMMGITSRGLHCDNYPAIFTEVSHYLDWIRLNSDA